MRTPAALLSLSLAFALPLTAPLHAQDTDEDAPAEIVVTAPSSGTGSDTTAVTDDPVKKKPIKKPPITHDPCYTPGMEKQDYIDCLANLVAEGLKPAAEDVEPLTEEEREAIRQAKLEAAGGETSLRPEGEEDLVEASGDAAFEEEESLGVFGQAMGILEDWLEGEEGPANEGLDLLAEGDPAPDAEGDALPPPIHPGQDTDETD